MAAYLQSRLSVVWLFLTLVTFVSWWVGAGGEGDRVDLPITFAVVAIALCKAHLVFWHFMEVRSGPSWLRWSCGGWLAFLGIMVPALYDHSL